MRGPDRAADRAPGHHDVRSALPRADERAAAEVAARLAQAGRCPRRLDALVFTDPTGGDTKQGDGAAVDGDTSEEDEGDVPHQRASGVVWGSACSYPGLLRRAQPLAH
ncbi:hypothetical protein AB0L49_40665 [Streptomyces antimycoticus]|uniref:hypothetical protein n=1 Tax=Streptomyces antimycoticus TaxID=68175 RepID=UPI00342A7288